VAETIELILQANGVQIQGEPIRKGGGRTASGIEVVKFEHSGRSKRDAASGAATGRRRYEPITIRKRLDKATPLLAKALALNERIDGTFKFYRPAPGGDGTTEQFYTIEISNGQVDSIRQYVEDCLNPTSSAAPPMEEVAFTFETITWTFEDGGVTHTDSWENGA
jgi:type VI secretion system secreted protein Hcp